MVEVIILYNQGVSLVMRINCGCGFLCIGRSQKIKRDLSTLLLPDIPRNATVRRVYVIVVTHARVPHGIYWLSSDLGPRAAGLEGKGTTEPIYPMCARVSCVTTDLPCAFLSVYTSLLL